MPEPTTWSCDCREGDDFVQRPAVMLRCGKCGAIQPPAPPPAAEPPHPGSMMPFVDTAQLPPAARPDLTLEPKQYRDGEPCAHRGCLSHFTHPCEGCGRIAGRYPEAPAATRTEPDGEEEFEAWYERLRQQRGGSAGPLDSMSADAQQMLLAAYYDPHRFQVVPSVPVPGSEPVDLPPEPRVPMGNAESMARAVVNMVEAFRAAGQPVSTLTLERYTIASAYLASLPGSETGGLAESLAAAVKLLDEAEDELGDGAGGHEILGAELGMLRIRLDAHLAALRAPALGEDTRRLDVLEILARQPGGILLHDERGPTGRTGLGLMSWSNAPRTLRQAVDQMLPTSTETVPDARS